MIFHCYVSSPEGRKNLPTAPSVKSSSTSKSSNNTSSDLQFQWLQFPLDASPHDGLHIRSRRKWGLGSFTLSMAAWAFGRYHEGTMKVPWRYHVHNMTHVHLGLSENRLNAYTQWCCWSLSLWKMAISLGVYPIFRQTHLKSTPSKFILKNSFNLFGIFKASCYRRVRPCRAAFVVVPGDFAVHRPLALGWFDASGPGQVMETMGEGRAHTGCVPPRGYRLPSGND